MAKQNFKLSKFQVMTDYSTEILLVKWMMDIISGIIVFTKVNSEAVVRRCS